MRGPSPLRRACPAARLPATGVVAIGREAAAGPAPSPTLIRLARALGAAAAREAFRAGVDGSSLRPEDGQ